MYRTLTIALTTISLTFGLFATRLAESAQASFTCGPHLRTYSVRALNGASGQGVRCVMPNGGAWYGEGYWGNVTYRHVGEKLGNDGYAGDISGNGEIAAGAFLTPGDLRFSGSWYGNNPSRRIQVTGTWAEEWILETDNVVQEYTSPLGPVSSCGPNFSEYNIPGIPPGEGIRCALYQQVGNNQVASNVWYGQGSWGSRSYAHIGQRIYEGNKILNGAFDICEPSKFSFCGSADFGSIHLTDGHTAEVRDLASNLSITVTGAWNEVWKHR